MVGEYHKIQSLFKRDERTHKFIEGEFSLPEFEYLCHNTWVYTEKIDGTNVRIDWNGETRWIGGRTKDAQIPPFLLDRLQHIFPAEKFKAIYPDTPMCLYGEGFGARIQKGGGNYIANGVDFILFDVRIGDFWLRRDDIEDIASKLSVSVVPIVGQGTLTQAIDLVQGGLFSTFGDFQAEGVVLKPEVELMSRMGHRIITKIKHKDFSR